MSVVVVDVLATLVAVDVAVAEEVRDVVVVLTEVEVKVVEVEVNCVVVVTVFTTLTGSYATQSTRSGCEPEKVAIVIGIPLVGTLKPVLNARQTSRQVPSKQG